MRLTVTGRFVDLDFGTVTPIKLSQQFSQESIAQSAARAIAVQLGIEKYSVYSAETQTTAWEIPKQKGNGHGKAIRRNRVARRMQRR